MAQEEHRGGYRDPAPKPQEKKPSWWRTMWQGICGLFGHDFITVRINGEKHAALLHLHPRAGLDCYCLRCGYWWDDAD